jgi:putative ABC transport system permease protein
MMGSTFKLSWDQFVQQYKNADNRLLRASQFCLLFFLLSLSLTSASVQHFLGKNMQQLLGADLVVSQYQPLEQSQLSHLIALSTDHTLGNLLNVTLSHGENFQSAQLKVVDDNYPLQGSLKITRSLSGKTINSPSGPGLGLIWLDSRLFAKLNLFIGQTLEVAGQILVVDAIIEHEPDRLLEGHSVAMRAMIHNNSLQKMTLLGDVMAYRYAFNNTDEQRLALLDWSKTHLPSAQVLHREGGHPLALFWLRVENFLGLASVLLFLMAAIAIDLVGRRQLISQKRFVALCLSMGMSTPRAIAVTSLQWFINFLSLLPLTLVLVYAAQVVLVGQLQSQFSGLAMAWHVGPLLQTLAILFVLLLTFQIPGWIELSRVSVAHLIKEQVNKNSHWMRLGWSLLSIGGLAAFYADNWLLTALTLGAMIATVVMLMALTWLVLTVGEKLSQGRAGLLPFALFMMKQRLVSKSMQILGVGLCAMLLLSTLGLMKDIGQTMGKYTRSHDGNLIVSQAKGYQVDSLKQWATSTGSTIRQLKPYAPSQLIGINGKHLSEHSDRPSDSMASLQKQVRVHWTAKVPANNLVESGQWWQQDTTDWQQISVEQEVMTDVGLALGDTLQFMIDGQTHDFIIKASHVFKPGKGSVTFWFQVPPAFVEKFNPDAYYMGSMELPESAWPQLAKLWQQHPTLRLMSIKEMTQRFDSTLGMITMLVGVFSVMISLLALLVIVASVKGFEAEERRKNGLLLSFGQSKANCLKLTFYEWLITGLVAGGGAVCGTVLSGLLIYQSQFSMVYQPNPFWLMATLAIVIALVCTIGLLGSRLSLKSSIKQLIQSV